MYTISARQLQREYTKVLAKANKIKEPFIVMSNNKPKGAIIGLDLLEQLRIEATIKEALREHKAGNTQIVDTPKKLKAFFEEIRKAAK